MGSEDFSFFANEVPGFFYRLGQVKPGTTSGDHHTPTFLADDSVDPSRDQGDELPDPRLPVTSQVGTTMADYAKAKEVYKELREALGPWTKANGFRKWPARLPAGSVPRACSSCFASNCEVSAWGNSETGNSLTGWVQTDPSPGDLTATPIRQDFFTSCLIGLELDRLAAIEGGINRRARAAFPEQRRRC